MKKKLVLLLTAVLTISMLAGCGDKGNEVESSEAVAQSNEETVDLSSVPAIKDMDVDKYVTVGNYKEIKVDYEAVNVTDADVDVLVSNYYTTYATQEDGVTDRAVEVGDTVIIDYVGKKDGVAFDGGTANGASLGIGSGQFIAGFEEGLVGVMPGETVDLELTFPTPYHSPELEGADVVFTVTVHYILPEKMADAVVAKMGIEGVSNEAELRTYLKDMLDQYATNMNESNKQTAVLDAFLNDCKYEEFTPEMIAKYEAMAEKMIQALAANYGMMPEDYVSNYYGMELDAFVSDYAVEALKQHLAMQAVANRENLNITDDELEEMLQEYATAAGMSSVEEYLGKNTREEFRESFMYDKVFKYLVGNAVKAE